MAESDSGEKTEDATPQRREDFRKRGQVTQTKELGTVLLLFSSVLAMWLLGQFFMKTLVEIFSHSFTDYIIRGVREGDYLVIFFEVIKKMMILVSPLFGLFFVVAFASSALQIGFLVNEEALQFKIEKLNPMEGLKRIFSLRSLVEGAKAIFKVTCVGVVLLLVVKSEIELIPHLVSFSVPEIMVYLGDITFKLLVGVGFFMTVIAFADYMFQRFDLEKKMRMSKQEVKEELKSREGDPLIKSRIRRVQREMAQRRMMQDVPTADVVITNPTHIAVALKYDSNSIAPIIVAMGADSIAEKIKEIARNNNVPVMENKPLARVIFKTLKIGQMIPRELYTAVAEVLSYVYKLKKKVTT